MLSFALSLAVASLAPLPAAPPPTACPSLSADSSSDLIPSSDLSEPLALELRCTCRCGDIFVAVDPGEDECKDVTGRECITRGGQVSNLDECAMRYIDVTKIGGELEPELIGIGPSH